MAKLGEKLFNWFDERYNIRGFIEFMSHKSVPQHRHSIWYYFGGVSLFLFIIQVLTGILLLLYYRVGEDSSYMRAFNL